MLDTYFAFWINPKAGSLDRIIGSKEIPSVLIHMVISEVWETEWTLKEHSGERDPAWINGPQSQRCIAFNSKDC